MKWTEAQQSAIDAPKPGTRDSQTLLVAAAAGSGKTAVLVERIIQRLQRKELSVRELLVVTFTKAAAAEMCGRVGAKLAEVFAETQDPYLEEQLNLLPSAHISTLHSFCQWVIKSYFYQLDLDPSFRIGNEGELSLLQADVLDALLLAAHQSGDQAIADLSDFISDMRSDEKLKALILETYQFVMAQSYPEGWMRKVEAQYDLALTQAPLETPWGQGLWEQQQQVIQALVGMQDELRTLCESPAGHPTLVAYVDEVTPLLTLLQEATTWEDMHLAVATIDGFSFKRWSVKKDVKEIVDEGTLSRAKAMRDALKTALTDMKTSPFACSSEAWKLQLENQVPFIKALLSLVRQFIQAYGDAKKEEGMLDFSDLEHLCLALLVAPGTEDDPQPSVVAQELQSLFKEVMVDEYQDTNGVQEAIVNLVSRSDNRFYVGDVKQSIYRFRMADPSLFMDKYRSFARDLDAEERRIDLAQNFRSHGNILAFTNFVFRQIMTEEGAELAYGDAEALYVGRVVEDPPENWVGGDVEVMLVDMEGGTGLSPEAGEDGLVDLATTGDVGGSNGDGTDGADGGDGEDDGADVPATEREIAMIIDRMKRMKAEGQVVQDKDGSFRPVAWRDMVILHRSVNSVSSLLMERLRAAGIPAYAEEKTGYFNALEVQLLLSLLQIIDNPQQDLPMAAILRSFIVGLSVEELTRLRLSGDGSLWDVLPAYIEGTEDDRVASFVAHMERWRTLSRRKGISDLLLDIFETLHIVDYVSAMPNGIVRRANVLALYDRAKQYETGGFRGLFRFLRFLENLQQSGQDLGIAKTVSEADDVVRIMSIHKSKGLEFPVVFLMAVQKQFNNADIKNKVLLHKEAGLGIKGFYPGPRVIYDSVPWQYVKRCITLANKAEEERVLYVALTRAKDKLIITGSVKNFEKRCESYAAALVSGTQALPTACITKASSYLDWILMAISRHRAGNPIRVYSGVEAIEIPTMPERDCDVAFHVFPAENFTIQEAQGDDVSAELLAVKALAPLEAEPLDAALVARMTTVYPFAGAVQTAAKISVSEMKRRFQEKEDEAEALVSYPRGVEVSEKADAEGASEAVDAEGAREAVEVAGASEDELVRANAVVDTPLEGVFAEKPTSLMAEEAVASGAQWGTLMHEAMQWLPVAAYTRESMKAAVDALVVKGYITESERKVIRDEALYRFYASSLGKRLVASQRVEKEWPFSQLIPAKVVYPEVEDGEALFLQGIIDLVFWDGDGWVLVDYKTDRVASVDELGARYAVQLRIYREALETLTGEPVKETFIWSLRLHEAYLLPR